MSHVVKTRDPDLDDPYLVEGLPGAGLVGTIAVDHLTKELDMEVVATCECDGIPDVAVFDEEDRGVEAAVRVVADDDHDLLALVSHVPVSPNEAACFARCLVDWIEDVGATPILLSGLGDDDRDGGESSLYGVATGGIGGQLDGLDVPPPARSGQVSGPTGALLDETRRRDLPALGVIAEADTRFPDPAAARSVVEEVVAPLAGVDISSEALIDQAEEIKQAKRELAEQLGEASGDESSRAITTGMYQ